MSVGSSGRIVIEIEPGLKKELYDSLKKDGMNLKEWFLARAHDYLADNNQLSLPLTVEEEKLQEAISK